MSDPTGFMKFRRIDPRRRPVAERIHDWKEFYEPMPEEELRKQGGRCMDCGVPFCHGPTGCPVENMIPYWNDMVHQGRWKDALKALHATNNFPEFTGRLCPAPCESACVLGINSDPVSIRVIEWNIIDRGFEQGWVVPIPPVRETGRTVAVVGSGPAGLACAQQLRRAGHQVVVYEKADRPGGLLRYGIPDFKMEKWVLDRRLEQLRAEGVEFRTGVRVGEDVSVEQLRREHDALCLAVGAERPRDLQVAGRELKGIHFAMDYLRQQNRRDAGDGLLEPRIDARGKRVVIIGGGDTGSDCLGTAIRQGCVSAHQFELLPRPPEERSPATPWPLWPMKLRTSHAHEEGCSRDWSVSTTGFLGRDDGSVRGLQAVRVRFENRVCVPVSGSEFELAADLVILAMGFSGPAPGALLDRAGIAQDSRGNIGTDRAFMTNVRGVFAGGDARRGASLIVWAIAEGRKMALAVDRYLRENEA